MMEMTLSVPAFLFAWSLFVWFVMTIEASVQPRRTEQTGVGDHVKP